MTLINARHNRCDNGKERRRHPSIPGATITYVQNKNGEWRTAYVTTFNDYEFVIKKSLGKWVASCYQVTGWEFKFPIVTPVSDICPTLADVAIDWALEAKYYAEDWQTADLPATSQSYVLESDQYGVYA